MSLRGIASLFIAVSELAPQSMRILVSRPVRWRQVLNRPPEPKASPQPTNCSRIEDLRNTPKGCGAAPPVFNFAGRRFSSRDEHHNWQAFRERQALGSTRWRLIVFLPLSVSMGRRRMRPQGRADATFATQTHAFLCL